jgi:hypothetical protein
MSTTGACEVGGALNRPIGPVTESKPVTNVKDVIILNNSVNGDPCSSFLQPIDFDIREDIGFACLWHPWCLFLSCDPYRHRSIWAYSADKDMDMTDLATLEIRNAAVVLNILNIKIRSYISSWSFTGIDNCYVVGQWRACWPPAQRPRSQEVG